MPSVRRPRWEIIASTVVRELHPLLARNIHEIEIGCSWLSRSIFPHPRESEKLPVRSPTGGNCISLVGHALLIRAVRLHRINLRQSRASADEGDLTIRLSVPYGRNIRALISRQTVRIRSRGIRHVDLWISPFRRGECQLRSITGPSRRQIRATHMREAHYPVDLKGVHHYLPPGLGESAKCDARSIW